MGGVVLAMACSSKTVGTSKDTLVDAAAKGDLARATLLVDAGADATEADGRGVTPLHHAALSGNVDLVEFLIDRGADPDAQTDTGETPLHWAVTAGQAPIAEFLVLKKGVNVNARSADDKTALDLAETSQGEMGPLVKILRFGGGKRAAELDAVEPGPEVVSPGHRAPGL